MNHPNRSATNLSADLDNYKASRQNVIGDGLIHFPTLLTGARPWQFVRAVNGSWTWLAPRKNASAAEAEAFPSLDTATANAAAHGFEPFRHFWTATVEGRATHYPPAARTVTGERLR